MYSRVMKCNFVLHLIDSYTVAFGGGREESRPLGDVSSVCMGGGGISRRVDDRRAFLSSSLPDP